MQFSKAILLPFIVGQVSALVATFDQSNINLSNYMSASFPNFTVVDNQDEPQAIKPQSGYNYIEASNPGSGGSPSQPATGTLLLNAHSSYGHLSSFYLACYSPATAVPQSSPCSFTMAASCYDLNSKLDVFTLAQQYATNKANTMQFVNLTSFYSFYAQKGYFPGTGSTAKCTKYVFTATQSPGYGLGAGFFLDTMTYTVTT